MAKEVSNVEEIVLLDGTEVTLRSASIKTLKQFMKVFKKMEDIKEIDNDAIMDILVEASAVALKKQLPDVAGFVDLDPESKNADVKKRYAEMREQYEEMVDMDIVNKVNEVCGGIKFDDPNLLAAAREAVGTT